MTEPSWRPVLRSPRSTVTRVLQSAAFQDPVALRALADAVLLSWVFGTVVNELEPFLADEPDS
ncbi:MAG: hypothetical protein ACR2JU_09155 [Nocardioidaceae bacterium]